MKISPFILNFKGTKSIQSDDDTQRKNKFVSSPLERHYDQDFVDLKEVEPTQNVRSIGQTEPERSDIPAIQFKVRGVTAHQTLEDGMANDDNINQLAQSEWQDEQRLDLKVKNTRKGVSLVLSDPNTGEVGRVPDEVAKIIAPVVVKHPNNFKCELSNIIAGTTKGAETIGLRANIKYVGDNENEKKKTQDLFNKVLNSKDCSSSVLLYQPKKNPDQVLSSILDYEKNLNGAESSLNMRNDFKNIANTINDPENKNILLIGHCKPDGDTLGSILGLKNIIKLAHPEKDVSCAIDDRVPGLFRHKMPGIDGEIKHPFNEKRVNSLENLVSKLESEKKAGDESSEAQEKRDIKLNILNRELEGMKNKNLLVDKNKHYNSVILMDVPTPKRFTDKFKDEISSADKVAYIDHHPHRLNEWQNQKDYTGLDMQKVHKDGLALVTDFVPAATELVPILGSEILPELKDVGKNKLATQKVLDTPEKEQNYNAYVASAVVGMSTDTGAFTRTANLLPEHMKLPVEQRPNFYPEGLSKQLMSTTNDSINKKWLREEISYDISDDKVDRIGTSARDKMLGYANAGEKVDKDLSLGIVQVNYDQMEDVWLTDRLNHDSESTLLDVQNAFKYSEVMGTLRSNPEKQANGKSHGPENKTSEANDYKGKYDNDRIAVLICQDNKAGELDEKYDIAKQNSLRLSLRSQEGTTHAELLASLFAGGGHGGAAGAAVVLPGVDVNTKLGVQINGKIETNPDRIYKTLTSNYDVMHNDSLTDDQKQEKCDNISIVKDENGKPCADIIKDMVKEIRVNQPKKENDDEIPEKRRSTHAGRRHHRNTQGNKDNFQIYA